MKTKLQHAGPADANSACAVLGISSARAGRGVSMAKTGRPIIEMIGRTFGRLTVLEDAGPTNSNERRYLCICECGGKRRVRGARLRHGEATDCGCGAREIISRTAKRTFTVHGLSRTPTYSVWHGIIGRCTNPKSGAWKNYGGRGISVCERWRDFLSFLEDMGERPQATEIDRIDNDGNYEPGNCRWVTRRQNLSNRRNSRFLSANGNTMTIAEWSIKTGIQDGTIRARLRRKCSPEEALAPV